MPTEIVSVLTEATAVVPIVKVPVDDPVVKVTVAGTVAEGSLEVTGSEKPAAAGPLIVTVPVEEVPPWTGLGLTLTPVAVGAVIASPRLLVTGFPPIVAAPVMFAVAFVATGTVVTVKLADERLPAVMVTDGGTVAAGLSEVNVMTVSVP